MAIGVGDVARRLVRQGQIGSLATLGQATDQTTLDLLASMNARFATIWGRGDWKWVFEPLRIALTPGTRQYGVTAVSGNLIDRIRNLIPFDPTGTFLQGRPLNEHAERDFYNRVAQPVWQGNSISGPTSFNQGYPRDYYNLGQVNGVWQIIVDPVPNLAGFLGGSAKMVLPVYTYLDVANNTPISYFPNNIVQDALFQGCMIDVGLIRQVLTIDTAAPAEAMFKKKIDLLWSDQSGVAADNTPPTTRLPPTVGRLRRWRRGRFC